LGLTIAGGSYRLGYPRFVMRAQGVCTAREETVRHWRPVGGGKKVPRRGVNDIRWRFRQLLVGFTTTRKKTVR